MWGLVVHNLVKNCNYMEWYSNDSVQTTCKGYNIPVIYVGFTDFDSKFVDIYDDALQYAQGIQRLPYKRLHVHMIYVTNITVQWCLYQLEPFSTI